MRICQRSGKKIFASPVDAQRSIHNQRKRGKAKEKLHCYRCNFCGEYHTTKLKRNPKPWDGKRY